MDSATVGYLAQDTADQTAVTWDIKDRTVTQVSVKAGIPVTFGSDKRPLLFQINTFIEMLLGSLQEMIGRVYFGEEMIQEADDEFYLCLFPKAHLL